jgi:hypothetical protein
MNYYVLSMCDTIGLALKLVFLAGGCLTVIVATVLFHEFRDAKASARERAYWEHLANEARNRKAVESLSRKMRRQRQSIQPRFMRGWF